MDKGTIVAVVPIDVPTIKLDIGNITIISIINGKERSTFIILFNILFNKGFSHILSFSVITKRIPPKGNPINNEKL